MKQSNSSFVMKKKLLQKCKELINVIEKNLENKNEPLPPLITWSGGKSDEIKHFQKYIP